MTAAMTKPDAGEQRVWEAQDRVLQAAKDTHAAWQALNGCIAGPDFDRRVMEARAVAIAEMAAVGELKAAEAARAEDQTEEG